MQGELFKKRWRDPAWRSHCARKCYQPVKRSSFLLCRSAPLNKVSSTYGSTQRCTFKQVIVFIVLRHDCVLAPCVAPPDANQSGCWLVQAADRRRSVLHVFGLKLEQAAVVLQGGRMHESEPQEPRERDAVHALARSGCSPRSTSPVCRSKPPLSTNQREPMPATALIEKVQAPFFPESDNIVRFEALLFIVKNVW